MKIEPVTCIWMFGYAMNFELPEMARKWSFRLFTPNLPSELFHSYFVCKVALEWFQWQKIVILDQNKPKSQILKNKKSRIQNVYNKRKLNVYYS